MADHRIRVLIVDDSVVARMILQTVISEDPQLELVGSESNGQSALDKLGALRPDVMILDVEMPGLSGIETVAALRTRDARLPVIMFSSLTADGASVTIEALARGASDFVTKPSQTSSAMAGLAVIREQLLPKIKALGSTRSHLPVVPIPVRDDSPVRDASPVRVSPLGLPVIELVCIATSTGGPVALEAVLTALPANFPVPIVIVQHMPAFFTAQLAKRLSDKCAIRVREAQSGEPLEPGTALIAPGDFHLRVRRRGTTCYTLTNSLPQENSCRPAADVLFRSAAEEYGNQVFGVVMTGMGVDGLKGCEAIKAAGGRIVVQDEATSVIWGMPGAVARAGLASKELPLDKIAAEVIRTVREGRR